MQKIYNHDMEQAKYCIKSKPCEELMHIFLSGHFASEFIFYIMRANYITI